MPQEIIILLIVLIMGLVGRNMAVAIAAVVLLGVRFLNLGRFLPLIQSRGLDLGIIIITIAVLAPLASGKVKLGELLNLIKNPYGLIAIGVGILVAYLGGRGVKLLGVEPQVSTALILGTVAGVAFFKGLPVGPVIAAGIAAVLFQILHLAKF